MKIAVIQGPNINLLGIKEQHLYGPISMEMIHQQLENIAKQNINVELAFFQSNIEGELVDVIQECSEEFDGILINPSAYSHTSIAIKDAIMAIGLPAVEVHISNIYKREEFRQKSITASSCVGMITGFGVFGYHMGLMSLIQIITEIDALKKEREAAE